MNTITKTAEELHVGDRIVTAFNEQTADGTWKLFTEVGVVVSVDLDDEYSTMAVSWKVLSTDHPTAQVGRIVTSSDDYWNEYKVIAA